MFVLVSGVGMVTCGMFTDRLSRNRPTRKLTVAIAYCLASFTLLSRPSCCRLELRNSS